MLFPSILCSNCWWRFSVAGSVRRRNPRPKMCWVNSFFQLNCHVHILFCWLADPILHSLLILKSFLFELMFKNIPIHLYFPFCFQRIDPQYEYRQTSKLGWGKCRSMRRKNPRRQSRRSFLRRYSRHIEERLERTQMLFPKNLWIKVCSEGNWPTRVCVAHGMFCVIYRET